MKYLQKLIPLWKPARAFLPWALLGAILFVAFWIRIQGVPNIPEGQFYRKRSVSPLLASTNCV